MTLAGGVGAARAVGDSVIDKAVEEYILEGQLLPTSVSFQLPSALGHKKDQLKSHEENTSIIQ